MGQEIHDEYQIYKRSKVKRGIRGHQMSRYTGSNAQRLIQSKAGFVSVAALLCLSTPARLSAQPAQTAEPPAQPPAQQTTPAPSTETPSTPAAQPPAGQTPSAQTPTPSTPLPTVQVTGNQPQRPARPAAAPPARQATPAPPAPPAEPVAATTSTGTAGPGTSQGYQASTLGVGRIATQLLDTPQTVNVVTQQVIREQNATTVRDGVAQRRGCHVPRGRRRQPGRHALHPWLLRTERHLP